MSGGDLVRCAYCGKERPQSEMRQATLWHRRHSRDLQQQTNWYCAHSSCARYDQMKHEG